MSYSVVVDVAAPPEVVWQVLVDVEAWPDITPSMTSVERLDDGPLRVGSTARVRQPGMPVMVWRVTELSHERSFTWEASSLGVVISASHEIEPVDGGVRLTLGIRQTGPLAGVVRLLSGRRTQRYINLEAAGLRDRAQAKVS